jgi:phosphonate transport system substrate-binding protein
MNSTSKYVLGFLIFFFLFALLSCNPATLTPATITPSPVIVKTTALTKTNVPTITPTKTLTPTPEPTKAPLGEKENPIVLGIVYEKKDTQSDPAQKFIQYLANKTGFIFNIQSFHTHLDLLTAMEKGDVSFAWLQPLTYLYAYDNGIATVSLLTNNYGVYAYGSQFLVRADSKYKVYFNPDKNETTANASSALSQFSKGRPCLVNDQSISLKISIAPPALQQSATSVIRALYAGGICDFGVTYAYSGDPRTSTDLQNDLPDVMDKVVVAWRSEPVIPTLNLSFNTKVPLKIRTTLVDAILAYSKLPKGLKQINQLTNYEVEELKPVDNSVYDSLSELVSSSGVNLENFFGN